MIEFDSGSSESLSKVDSESSSFQVKVLGIGGAGCSILSRLNFLATGKIEFFVLNSDKRSLEVCEVKKRIQLGKAVVRGWGTGGNPELGRQIALGEKDKIRKILKGAALALLVSGFGKGMGTGASPVIAQLAREMGTLTVGFAVLPFSFEGSKRVLQARNGLRELEKVVDTLMIIPNDSLLNKAEETPYFKDSFRRIDGILERFIQAVDSLLFHPGLISVDFADFRSLLEKKGHLRIAIGRGEGEEAAQEAARDALSLPLGGKNSLKGVEGMLIHIRGGENLSLSGAQKAVLDIEEAISSRAEIIFGASIDEGLSDEVVLTLIAIGSEDSSSGKKEGKLRSQQEEFDLGAYKDDDLDIPTFLRKRKN